MTLRIDAHQHFWRYRVEDYPWIGSGMDTLARDQLPADLLPLLRSHDMAATIAVQARSGREETRFLLELARQEDWIAGVVGWENLGVADLAERLSEWRGGDKLVGFRHQVQDEADARTFLEQPDFNRGVALLQKQGYVYDVLVFGRQLADTLAFCTRHDRHWLVLDHLGKPALREFVDSDAALMRWKKELFALGKLPHVACKLSGLVTEADWQQGLREDDYVHIRICLDAALEAFGAQRLMFGSDWPVCLLAASYDKVVGLVSDWADANLNKQEQAALWGGTAAHCYGIVA